MAKFSRKSVSSHSVIIIFFSADDKIYRTFVKHINLHVQFVKRYFLDHRVKKPSLPL